MTRQRTILTFHDATVYPLLTVNSMSVETPERGKLLSPFWSRDKD